MKNFILIYFLLVGFCCTVYAEENSYVYSKVVGDEIVSITFPGEPTEDEDYMSWEVSWGNSSEWWFEWWYDDSIDYDWVEEFGKITDYTLSCIPLDEDMQEIFGSCENFMISWLDVLRWRCLRNGELFDIQICDMPYPCCDIVFKNPIDRFGSHYTRFVATPCAVYIIGTTNTSKEGHDAFVSSFSLEQRS